MTQSTPTKPDFCQSPVACQNSGNAQGLPQILLPLILTFLLLRSNTNANKCAIRDDLNISHNTPQLGIPLLPPLRNCVGYRRALNTCPRLSFAQGFPSQPRIKSSLTSTCQKAKLNASTEESLLRCDSHSETAAPTLLLPCPGWNHYPWPFRPSLSSCHALDRKGQEK